ncbi:MAG: type II toxin-antitoxin system VapC family toxin [Rubrivivax sp.]|nr:type II toxin-antitoxin system VapC family toxin [Rubrivivax sp.]MCW5612896.1 type II toxin-antitoxin system VapC family toxin [Rubrivivax sp.]
MIAVDTSVLVDYIGDGPQAEAAEGALRAALSIGPVVACEVVLSEVVAGLGHGDIVMETLDAVGIGFSPLEQRAAVRAGEMQRRYKERLRRGSETAAVRRSVPDFLIGAHALLQCQALITRDAGFFRDYFKGLKVIVPKA